MKIFISWSGEKSRSIAEIFHRWLPSVVQAVIPYFSPEDNTKGARWSTEIADELEASRIGILILTRESLNSPWIMFEAGALSKNIGETRVAPILFDLEPAEIEGPLVQFQSAIFTKAEIKRLLRMINSELGDSALSDGVL